MFKIKDGDGAKADFQRMQLNILFLYIVIVFVVVASVSALMVSVSDRILSRKVSALISANSKQLELNINNYLELVEKTSALLFSDEDYYLYSPVDSKLDEYSTIKREEAIKNRIVELDLMENFCDFNISYPDGSDIGMTANSTTGLDAVDNLYEVLENSITNEKQQSGWCFGIGGATDKLFYVKRLNPNAILTVSFYSRELSNVFKYPKQLDGMRIDLVDDNDTILYSSDKEIIGGQLEGDIKAILNGAESIDNARYFVNSNRCENGWRVVCSISKDIIFRDTNRLKLYTILGAMLLSFVFIAGGLYLITRLTKPVDRSVSNLETEAVTDRLSGLYNKLAFQDVVTQRLAHAGYGNPQVFIMCDMDNFKSINDTLGHAYGDEVISRMGHLLSDNFKGKYVIGRLGGDEFAMYTGFDRKNAEESLQESLDDLRALFVYFDKEFEKEKQQIPISLSIGITVQDNERRFNNLYKNADTALYASKHGGKNRYTVYEPGKEKEE